MRTREQRFWDRLQPRLRAAGVWSERIENVVGSGHPDVETLCDGLYVPVELKAVADFPKRPTTPVLGKGGLRQSQKNWWLEWTRHGGGGLIAVAVGSSRVYTFDGRLFDEINDYDTVEFMRRASFRSLDELVNHLRRTAQ